MFMAEILLINVMWALGMLLFLILSVALLNYLIHDPDKTKIWYPILKFISWIVAIVLVGWIGWAVFSGSSGTMRHSYDEEQNFDPRG